MWLVKHGDGDEKLFVGPRIVIGRKEDCDFCFREDKSVSRAHAEISLGQNGEYIKVRDLGAKFGTFVGVERVSSDDGTLIRTGVATVTFGVQTSKLEFKKLKWSVCPTRLDKVEKENLKALAATLGISVCSNVSENCTHVVSKKFSVTVKILEAIALRKTIVSMEWFEELKRLLHGEATKGPPLVGFPDVRKYVYID